MLFTPITIKEARDLVWSLHTEPHRHYKVTVPGRAPSWNGANKQRIVSVTTALGGGDTLAGWAAGKATAAAEQVAVDWLGAAPAMSNSVLSFGELCALQTEWPDNVKEQAGREGTAAHSYLAARLTGAPDVFSAAVLPYGLRLAVDKFLADQRPVPCAHAEGPCVERAVGDYARAVAGTYDAQARLADGLRHRADLKSSRMVQPTHFAQLAEYEREAVLCGEEPSDLLTIVHIDRLGDYRLHSIVVGSVEHRQAQALFDAYLAIHRLTPRLAKLFKGD